MMNKLLKIIKRHSKTDGAKAERTRSITELLGDPGPLLRLFIVGNGGVGKSTIIKQMQKLCVLDPHNYQQFDQEWNLITDVLSEDKRREFIQLVHHNILRAVGMLLEECENQCLQLSEPYESEAASSLSAHIGEWDTVHQREVSVSKSHAEQIKVLWSKPTSPLRQAAETCSNFPDSAQYFLRDEKLNEIASEHYIPTYDDVVRARNPTCHPNQYNFRVNKTCFTIKDTGGQQVERARLATLVKQWLAKTRPIDSNYILFVSSLAGFNVPLKDHIGFTSLDQSIGLLKTIYEMPALGSTGFIVFHNKRDVFEKKMASSADMERFYPEYWQTAKAMKAMRDEKELRRSKRKYMLKRSASTSSGSTQVSYNVEIAEAVINSLFSEGILQSPNRCNYRDPYFYYTTAVDTKIMEAVIAPVLDSLKHGGLKNMDGV